MLSGMITLKSCIINHLSDFVVVTRLRPGNADAIVLGSLCPSGYRFLHVPHITETFGFGIRFLFKESLAVNSNVCETFKSFDPMDISPKLDYIGSLFRIV